MSVQVDQVVSKIKQRWGNQAIAPLSRVSTPNAFSTGHKQLDDWLGIGGIPCGTITEFVGEMSSGLRTLALNIMQAVQSVGEIIVYLDPEETFDADYASSCDISLEHIWFATPLDMMEALSLTNDLVRSDQIGLIVMDVPVEWHRSGLQFAWKHLINRLKKSQTAILLLTSESRHQSRYDAAAVAAIRLLIERQHWLYNDHSIIGFESRITALKNRYTAHNSLLLLDFNLCTSIW